MNVVTVTDKAHDPRNRFGLYRLCACESCVGRGQIATFVKRTQPRRDVDLYGHGGVRGGMTHTTTTRCPDCRGEGRQRQLVAECESPEAVGVALVTLARESEWSECPFGLLDRDPECECCGGLGRIPPPDSHVMPIHPDDPRGVCACCKGSGIKLTGTWLILPWQASPRNVRDAARTLARSKTKPQSS